MYRRFKNYYCYFRHSHKTHFIQYSASAICAYITLYLTVYILRIKIARTRFKERKDKASEISKGNVYREEEETEKEVVRCDIRRTDVSVQNAADRVEVEDQDGRPQTVGKEGEGKEEENLTMYVYYISYRVQVISLIMNGF